MEANFVNVLVSFPTRPGGFVLIPGKYFAVRMPSKMHKSTGRAGPADQDWFWESVYADRLDR
jgi:hypothetical protein